MVVETVKSPAEQKVLLSNVSWETYVRLLEDHRDSSAPRFTFDRGMLEITSPSPEHEAYNRSVALLVEFVAEELGIDVYDLGSTTFRREDLERGFEPDSCFYIQNEERVRGKDRIDLSVDPPPDLVIEIDITSPSINKLPIYARLGVPEVWRYDGEKLEILKLGSDGYDEVSESVALPALTSSVLSRLVERSKPLRRTVWLREVRETTRRLSG
jgi:Uma2 family endonuclease